MCIESNKSALKWKDFAHRERTEGFICNAEDAGYFRNGSGWWEMTRVVGKCWLSRRWLERCVSMLRRRKPTIKYHPFSLLIPSRAVRICASSQAETNRSHPQTPTPTPCVHLFSLLLTPHMVVHFPLSSPPFGFTLNATLAASVNASFTPLFLIAEHSKYLSALILLATSNP